MPTYYFALLLQGHWAGAPTASTRRRALALLEAAAAEQNHSAAALQLGRLCRDGGDVREAARWLSWSARLGHPSARRELTALDPAALDPAALDAADVVVAAAAGGHPVPPLKSVPLRDEL